MKFAPTGTCFNDAIDILMAEYEAQPEEVEAKMRLVHGILRMEDGTRYAHAWLEDDEANVFEMVLIDGERTVMQFTREEFYDQRCVIRTLKYTLKAVAHMNAEHHTNGPWEQEMLGLVLPQGTFSGRH